jgi:UDP-glucose 4-epimerase
MRGQYAPVIGLFLRQKLANEPLTIVGDGEQKRDFTHVSDVVNANILAAIFETTSKQFGEIYNVGTGKNYSVLELAKMISDNITFIPPRPAESKISLASNYKINQTFGWEPTVILEEYIKEQLNG